MANQQKIGVTLEFQANTKSAQQQINELNNALNKVMMTTARTSGQFAFTKELAEASAAAAQLKTHIQNAVNVNTGKLDLSKFNQQLKQSGMTISQYRQALAQAGPAGQQAFNQLALSISTAEVPLLRINNGIKKLGTTLANTMRWQLSASMLQGFTGALSTAYNYAQDLNESLNNIRIVTNYSTEQMDKFAASATKAAKALSTTTTKYTDASLIYFQQGLADKEVQKRTELTIKMANVTGDSVSEVSNQLTAIWNNFDNGTKSLEHYADVLTALGAATASSTDEISQGLNKFAAVAETVGLSYEYAAAALATVTATTRESADVVGTAFKTLFARIQDLELGKTLDDGTTLGNYSQALANVGINIKDANGQMKQMDTILNEMGAKWNTLNEAQQTALAQNVAGVRQYTQLVALMENWDYFKENVQVANESAGALSEQAEIYAEGWQAARDRVTAALEDIYNKILEDDAFIKLLNMAEVFLTQISNIIDGLGGLKGVLTTLGTVLLTVFSEQAAQGLTNLSFSIGMATKTGRKQMQDLQLEATKQMAASYGKSGIEQMEGRAAAAMAKARQEYTDWLPKLNELQKEIAQHVLDQQNGLAQAAMKQAEYTKEVEKTARALQAEARAQIRNSDGKSAMRIEDYTNEKGEIVEGFNSKVSRAKGYGAALTIATGVAQFDGETEINMSLEDTKSIFGELQSQLDKMGITSKTLPADLKQMIKPVKGAIDAFKQYAGAVAEANAALNNKNATEKEREVAVDKAIAAENKLRECIESGAVSYKGLTKAEREAIEAAKAQGKAHGYTAIKTAEAELATERMADTLETATKTTRMASQDIIRLAQGIGSLATAFNALTGIWDVLNNEDMTFWEKLLSITTTLSITIPMLVKGWKALKEVEFKSTAEKIRNAFATWQQVVAEKALQEVRDNINPQDFYKDENIRQQARDDMGIYKRKQKWRQKVGEKASKADKELTEKAVKNLTDDWITNNTENLIQDRLAGASFKEKAAGAGQSLVKGAKGKLASLKDGVVASGPMIAIVAGVATAALSAYALYKELNKDAEAAKKAAEEAKKAEEIYNDAKNEYDSLKSSMSNYDNQIKGLQEMQKNTLEWKEAIAAANEEALKLIDAYDELAGKYHLEDGLIVFDEGALEEAQTKHLLEVQKAQRFSSSASKRAMELENQSNMVNFNRKYAKHNAWSDEDTASTGGGAGIGAGIGAAIGTIVATPGAGTVIGAAIGAAAGAAIGGTVSTAIGKDSTNEEERVVKQLAEIYSTKGNAIFADDVFDDILTNKLKIDDTDLINSLKEHKTELEDLIVATNANTEAMKVKNAADMLTFMEEWAAKNPEQAAKWSNSYDKTRISAAMSSSTTYERAKTEALASQYNAGLFGQSWLGGGKTDKKVHYEYLQAMGINDPVSVSYKNTNGGMTYVDPKTGNPVSISDETMRHFLAEEYAKQVTTKELDKYLALFSDTRAEATEVGQQYNLEKSDIAGISDAMAAYLAGDTTALASLTPAQMRVVKLAFQRGAFGLTTEEGKLTPYGDRNAAAVALGEVINNYDEEVAIKHRARAEQSAYNATLATTAQKLDINVEALDSYAEALARSSPYLEENTDLTAKSASAYATFATGVKNVSDTLSKNRGVLREWNEQSLDLWIAVGELQNSLKSLFGIDVSSNFIKTNLPQIEKLIAGDASVYSDLAVEAARDYINNSGIENTETKNALEQFASAVSMSGENLAKGEKLTLSSEILDSLDNDLQAGNITADVVQATLKAMGYEADIVGNTINSVTKIMDEKDLVGLLEDLAEGIDIVAERYHYLNRTLAQLSREYDKIAQARERAFGADKLAYYDKERDKAAELKSKLDEYAKQAETNYWSDRHALLSTYRNVKLDENGNISNYEELVAEYSNDEDFKKLVSNYENSLDTWNEKLQEAIDQEYKILDLKLEKIQYRIDLHLEIDDQTQQYLDFLIKMANDPLYDAANNIKHLTEKMNSSKNAAEQLGDELRNSLKVTGWDVSEINALLAPNANEATLSELLANNTLNETQIEQLKAYRDQLYAASEAMSNWTNEIRDTVIAAFDALGETFEESSQKLEHYNTILTTYENIIKLVGKDTLGIADATMAELSRNQVNNAMASLEIAKTAHDTNIKALEDLRNSYNENWSEKAKEAWHEAVKHAEEKVRESEATMVESWEGALQAAADAFEKAVETTVQAFEKAMSGIYGSFDAMQTAYDQQSTLNDRYVEDYEKIYELSKLNRKVSQSIDETDNVKAKRELAQLQQDILALSESDAEVSAYQIDYLQKQYDLKVAQIALEEAQNAKSQVRMQRDSEGNWGYVYTANEEDINRAEQNYEDKLYALQELNQEQIKAQSDGLIQLQQEFAQAMAAIKRENYATEVEYVAALQETQNYYQQMIDFRTSQLQLATDQAQQIYAEDWAKYSELTGYKLGSDAQWVNTFAETQIALVGSYTTISEYQTKFAESANAMVTGLIAAYQQWSTDMDKTMTLAGTSVEGFADTASEKIGEISTDTEKLLGDLGKMATDAQEAFKGVAKAAKENYDAYSKEIDKYLAHNLQLINSLNKIIALKTKVEGTGEVEVEEENLGNGQNINHRPNRHGTIHEEIYVDSGETEPPRTHIGGERREWAGDEIRPDAPPPGDVIRPDAPPAALTGGEGDQSNKESPNDEPDLDPPYEHGDVATIIQSESVSDNEPYVLDGVIIGDDEQSIQTNASTFRITSPHQFLSGVYWGNLQDDTLGNMGREVGLLVSRHLKPQGLDTGGYTGSWDSSGRLAMLHQKELVLNAYDTENFLAAVHIIRDVAKSIDLQAMAYQSGLAQMISMPAYPTGAQTLQQEVTIHAEFPNAVHRTEIEAAFDTLLNRASQFANRKK